MPAKRKSKTKTPRKSPTIVLKDQIKDLKLSLDNQNEKYLR